MSSHYMTNASTQINSSIDSTRMRRHQGGRICTAQTLRREKDNYITTAQLADMRRMCLQAGAHPLSMRH